MATIRDSFSYDTETDADVHRWIQSLPEGGKSAAIRQAIRAHIGAQPVTLADLHRELQQLRRELRQRAFVLAPAGQPPPDPDWPDEPADAAAALDQLGAL